MPAPQRFDAHKSRHDRKVAAQPSLPRQTLVTRPDDPNDNRIYVQPAWAVQGPPRKRGVRMLWRRLSESKILEAIRLEVKVLLLLGVIGLFIFMTFAGLKSFYRTKSEAGIDLTPFHAPNLVPFIR